MAWVSIIYVVCFFGVAMFPNILPGFMMYGLHMNINMGQNVVSFGLFLSGLIIWNVAALSATWLFALLSNKIK